MARHRRSSPRATVAVGGLWRAALADAYAAAGQAPPSYTEPTIPATVTPARASHIVELRAAVQVLE